VVDEKLESGVAPVDPRPESEILAEIQRDRAERNRAIRDARLVRTRRRPSVTGLAHSLPRTRSRQSRGTTTRTRGSRRTSSSSSSRAGPSDDDPGGEPPPAIAGLTLLYLADPRYGRVNRALARFLKGMGS